MIYSYKGCLVRVSVSSWVKDGPDRGEAEVVDSERNRRNRGGVPVGAEGTYPCPSPMLLRCKRRQSWDHVPSCVSESYVRNRDTFSLRQTDFCMWRLGVGGGELCSGVVGLTCVWEVNCDSE